MPFLATSITPYLALAAFTISLLVCVLGTVNLKPVGLLSGAVIVAVIGYLAPQALPVDRSFIYGIAAIDFVASFSVAAQNKAFAWALLVPHIAVALAVFADVIT